MISLPNYTVPENNRSSVVLCIDIGVELLNETKFTITAMKKENIDPPATSAECKYIGER